MLAHMFQVFDSHLVEMASTSHPFRSFLVSDSRSLRSFRSTSGSPAPSLKSPSLKLKAPLAKLFNSPRRNPTHTPTLKDLARPSFDEKELTLDIGLPM